MGKGFKFCPIGGLRFLEADGEPTPDRQVDEEERGRGKGEMQGEAGRLAGCVWSMARSGLAGAGRRIFFSVPSVAVAAV